jgi:hypothetical protein
MQLQQAKHAGFLLKGAARVITAHGRRGDGWIAVGMSCAKQECHIMRSTCWLEFTVTI